MDAKEALDILGLTGDATVEEIDRRYREVMLKEHPDQGGDTERAVQLNLARTAARDAAIKGQAAARKAAEQAARAAVEAQKAAERAAKKDRARVAAQRRPLGAETQSILDRMREERTRPLLIAQYVCGLLCLALAAVAVLTSPGVAPAVRILPRSYLWTVLFGLAAFVMGCCVSIVSSEIRRAQRRITALGELMETPVHLRSLIEDMLMDLVGRPPLARKKLEEEVQRAARQSLRGMGYDAARGAGGRLSRAHMAAVVFAVAPADMAWRSLLGGISFGAGARDTCDFGRLFVARGVEGGFVREERSVLRGAMWTGYVIVVPAASQPAPAG